MGIEEYKERLKKSGGSKRDRTIMTAQLRVKNYSQHSPAFKNDIEVDGVKQDLLIVSTQVMTTKTIEAMPGEDFSVGSIVLWNKSHWLITKRDADSDIAVRGTIEQCNRSIRWQNPQTLQIHDRWCVVDNPYSNSLNTTATLAESQRQFKIKMPYDEETSLLDLDKRFMLEMIGDKPKVYKITSVDNMTERYDYDGKYSGFLVVNVEQDVYNKDTDNKDLMICDYKIVPEVLPPQGPIGCSIKFNGDPEVRIGGLEKKFVAFFFDEASGDPILDIVPDWNVSCAKEIEQYVDWHVQENKLLISIKNNMAALGAIIEITLSSSEIQIQSTQVITVVPLV